MTIFDFGVYVLETIITPRFKDTDALGHINNASFPTWFEEARRPIFKLFIPDLDPAKWNLIVARFEIDFLAQTHYQEDVTIHTSIEKIGKSSFVVSHVAFQNKVEVAQARVVLVHFDYNHNKSVVISDEIKNQLKNHLKIEEVNV